MLNIILKTSSVSTYKGVTEKIFIQSGRNKIDLGISGKREDLAEGKQVVREYINDYLQLKKRGY